jgi:hypothetical protein
MSVSSITSQSAYLSSASSVSKSQDSTKIVTASSDTLTTSSVNATISTKWGLK